MKNHWQLHENIRRYLREAPEQFAVCGNCRHFCLHYYLAVDGSYNPLPGGNCLLRETGFLGIFHSCMGFQPVLEKEQESKPYQE